MALPISQILDALVLRTTTRLMEPLSAKTALMMIATVSLTS